MASHGFWQMLNFQEVIDQVAMRTDAKEAATHLATLATTKWEESWAMENVTVVVVYIRRLK